MKIVSEKKNSAMKRDEYIISVEHKGKATPNRPEIIKGVAKLIKVNDNLIIIDKIISNRGLQSSIAYVLSYRKRDDVPAYKLEKMKKRIEKIKPKSEAKQADAAPAAEEKPAEESGAPAEEKTAEEAPAEDKPAEEGAEEAGGAPEEKPAEEPEKKE